MPWQRISNHFTSHANHGNWNVFGAILVGLRIRFSGFSEGLSRGDWAVDGFLAFNQINSAQFESIEQADSTLFLCVFLRPVAACCSVSQRQGIRPKSWGNPVRMAARVDGGRGWPWGCGDSNSKESLNQLREESSTDPGLPGLPGLPKWLYFIPEYPRVCPEHLQGIPEHPRESSENHRASKSILEFTQSISKASQSIPEHPKAS